MERDRAGFWAMGALVPLWLAVATAGCGGDSGFEYTHDFLNDADYPQDFWPVATPEEVGLDGMRLIALSNLSFGIRSMLVVRNGKLVFERYGRDSVGHQFRPDDQQIIYSATKSIVSALIGIALEEGRIQSVEDAVLPYLDGYTPLNMSDAKAGMTIEDVLTMRSGLVWTEGEPDLSKLHATYEGVRYVLDKPLAAAPGTRWNYSSGDSQILTTLLYRVTGKSPLEYAQEKLFDPLGITHLHWDADGAGINWGGSQLYLTARDMAKFGYLFLHGGTWNGTEVVPASWVEVSTERHATSTPPFAGEYGYHWWLYGSIGYQAAGHGGQWIVVIPSKDLIVVFTALLDDKTILHNIVATIVAQLSR